jgi:hypothetical protein
MQNALIHLLKQNRAMLLERWILKTLQTYPAESARFYSQETNQFANPVGHALSKGLSDLFEALLDGLDVEAVAPILDSMVRIRAVQGFAPSKSLTFILFLKVILRDELGPEIQAKKLGKELVAFEERIDGVLLVAFDIYTQCRQRLSEIKNKEFISRHAQLLKRANLMSEETRLS